MSGILSDIRYSVRGLIRNPSLGLALLFTIALGIGSNLTVLGFVRGLTARKSAAPDTGVVSLFGRERDRGTGLLSYDDYLLLKSHSDVFEWVGAAQISRSAVKLAGQSEIVSVAAITPDLAKIFGLSLEGGVVISHRLGESAFHRKSDVAGEQVRIGGNDARVTGIAPEGLDGIYSGQPIDLWIHLHEESLQRPDRSARRYWLFAGQRPHVSTSQMQSATGKTMVLPYTGVTPEMAEGLSRTGTLLRTASAFVFFIACVNVASFLLGRAAFRSHANAIRVALGVSRSRVVRTVLCDSVVISLLGGTLSILFATWTLRVIPALLFEKDAELLVSAPRFLSIVMTTTVGAGIIVACGLVPLLEIRHDRPATVLGREAYGSSRTSSAVRRGLVIAQMAGCCLLVICTGYVYTGFRAALQAGATRRLGQPILATVQVHPDVNIDLRYFREVERKARSLTGVFATAWAARLPGSQPALQSFRVEPRGLPRHEIRMDAAALTASSMAEFSWPPKTGRSFGLADQGCRSAIVNEEAAALFGGDAVGRSIRDEAGMPVEIIGVVAARQRNTVNPPGRPTIYYDYTNPATPPPERIGQVRFSAAVASSLDLAELNVNVVSSDYFARMGLSLISGRTFPERPTTGCRIAVVNQEAADLYFAGNAAGAAIIDDLGQRTEIIGVVRSVPLGVFERRAEPTVYFPIEQDCLPYMTLIIGAQLADRAMLEAVQHGIERVPGRGPAPVVVKTLEAHLSQTALTPLRIATALVGACAATALLLGVLGLYGALNDAARARRKDLAIRIALGARRRDVIRHVLQEGGRLAGIGALAGALASLFLSRWLPQTGSNAGPAVLWAWIAGPLMLASAVVVAGILPARRALMLDPLRILRGN